MNLSMREIQYVLTIAEEGNITKAAQKLYIAQPSLSQALKKIEEEVSVPLFCRVKNRMQLTQSGELFVETGSKIMKAMRDLENNILDVEQLRGGHLSLGMPYHLGAVFVPAAITRYKALYPDIKLQLYESNSHDLENMVLNGTIDLAIMPLPAENPGLYTKTFFAGRMVLLVSQNHPLTNLAYVKEDGKPYFDLRNADGQEFIIGNQGQYIRKTAEAIFRKAGITPRIALQSKNIETIQRIAATGVGIALVPEVYLPKDPMELSANSYYLEPEQDVPWQIGTAYLNTGYLSSSALRFLEILDNLYSNLAESHLG
ncbi:LysR family transcriptional regulator [Marasmitruncus massiliensis]|uniref:LysR family transcriptional regulator n=1 Tax=Marasmitruncus massiliensis TaxID=1944642 RepID=UPI000C79F2EB|nr:LysR family transcriptional regulator [Marasmitruncus massiliensis]MBE6906580.1 LysR family transcriptional regulator [Oscillospiraceae bacterium]